MGQYCCHGEVLRHGSQKCSSDMVFFSSVGDNYVVEEAKGYASHQLPGLPDEASHCPILFQCTHNHEEYLQAFRAPLGLKLVISDA